MKTFERLGAMAVIAGWCSEIARAHARRWWTGVVVNAGVRVVAGLCHANARARSWRYAVTSCFGLSNEAAS